MVKVLPVPVCPYAKIVPLNPSRTESRIGAAVALYRFSCEGRCTVLCDASTARPCAEDDTGPPAEDATLTWGYMQQAVGSGWCGNCVQTRSCCESIGNTKSNVNDFGGSDELPFPWWWRETEPAFSSMITIGSRPSVFSWLLSGRHRTTTLTVSELLMARQR